MNRQTEMLGIERGAKPKNKTKDVLLLLDVSITISANQKTEKYVDK